MLAAAHRRFWVKSPATIELQKLGSPYGGWTVPVNVIKPGWICYCGGVGEDTTFDAELVGRGCQVFAFDPTPRAVEHVARNPLGEKFHFLPVGLWSCQQRMEFFIASDEQFSSASLVFHRQGTRCCEALCKSVPQLMGELGHRRVDLLKLDIEGAEYEVLKCVLSGEVVPTILCVEFDQPASPWKMNQTVAGLRSRRYGLVAVDELNYTFLNPSSH